MLRGNAETVVNSLGGLLGARASRQIPPGDPRAAHVVRWNEASAETRTREKTKNKNENAEVRGSNPEVRDGDDFYGSSDPRVHFALNCGARSCPPVSYYAGETLDRDLRLAATGFCEDDANVSARVSPTSRDTVFVTVSALFRWYRGDFGASDREVLERVEAWCPPGSAKRRALREALDHRERADSSREPFRMAYAPYDWSADATPESRTYAPPTCARRGRGLRSGFLFLVKHRETDARDARDKQEMRVRAYHEVELST